MYTEIYNVKIVIDTADPILALIELVVDRQIYRLIQYSEMGTKMVVIIGISINRYSSF